MDNISKKKRSEVMRAVKSSDSQIEKLLQGELRKKKHRFKTNVSSLQGKPDIVFARKKLAIFIDSCFWHGCRGHCRMPQANRVYWEAKVERNKMRDAEVNKSYKQMGWKVLRFWEHELKDRTEKVVSEITTALRKSKNKKRKDEISKTKWKK